MDTTRSDHCSVYGYELDTTPNLRRFAEQGARFELAYSPTSTTGPTHASLFTSVYPMEHGLVRNGLPLVDRFITLAEHLHEGGYQTAGVVSSYVLAGKFGYGQGFDFYDDRIDPATSRMRMEGQEQEDIEFGFDRPGSETTRHAIEWLDRERDPQRPFFLFLHYFDPHSPYAPPEPFLSRFAPSEEHPDPLDVSVGRYDGDIAFTDYQIGLFLDALEERGLEDNTIVVIVGDHGEGLMQHDHMGHGWHIYEESVRVPFLLRWPERIQHGLVFSAPVELLDVAPTLFDLIGLDTQALDLKGRSLAAALRGDDR
ncbi:MAG: sulfatase, partial [Gammaproteobacteria bacterium]|nr:sulfatase [Gammaproteobacteria bacterium]